MKKIYIALLMILGFMSLYSLTSIKAIRAEDYQSTVCRLVLDLNQAANFSVKQHENMMEIELDGFDGKDAPRSINSIFIQEIKVQPKGLTLKIRNISRFETMRLGETKQAVVDLFTEPNTLPGRLAVARFYSDRGKYASADTTFYALDRCYPDTDKILYHWGVLLKRRGSQRADDKLGQIKPESPYYEAAQNLIQGKKYIPDLIGEDHVLEEGTDSLALYTEGDSLGTLDSIIVATPSYQIPEVKLSFWEELVNIASRYCVLTILFFVSTLLILGFLIFGPQSYRKMNNKQKIGFEALAMKKMVQRLLADGWTYKEIARELKITVHEVSQIADITQSDDSTDQSDET